MKKTSKETFHVHDRLRQCYSGAGPTSSSVSHSHISRRIPHSLHRGQKTISLSGS